MISLSELKRAWNDGRSESEGDRRKGIWYPFNPLVLNHDSLARTLEDGFLPIILLDRFIEITFPRWNSFIHDNEI